MTDFLIGHVRQETAPTQLPSGLSDHLKSKKTYPKSIQNVNHSKFGHNTTGVMSGLDHTEVKKNTKTANPSFGQQTVKRVYFSAQAHTINQTIGVILSNNPCNHRSPSLSNQENERAFKREAGLQSMRSSWMPWCVSSCKSTDHLNSYLIFNLLNSLCVAKPKHMDFRKPYQKMLQLFLYFFQKGHNKPKDGQNYHRANFASAPQLKWDRPRFSQAYSYKALAGCSQQSCKVNLIPILQTGKLKSKTCGVTCLKS